MIEPKQILEALQECKRFEKRAREYLDRQKDQSTRFCGPTKESAALKRASMDLSRVLVKVR
jgi:hypothetical protein